VYEIDTSSNNQAQNQNYDQTQQQGNRYPSQWQYPQNYNPYDTQKPTEQNSYENTPQIPGFDVFVLNEDGTPITTT
jgi:hypothetical protein